MTREHRLGVVLLLTGLFIVGAALAAYAWRESRSLTFTAVFSDAKGLQAGDRVRLSGVDVGAVKWVQLNTDPARVHVRVKVEPKYAPLVRQGSTAVIDSSGSRVVEIVNADLDPPPPPLAKDSIIQGVGSRLELQVWRVKAQLQGAGDALAGVVGALSEQLKTISDSLKDLSASPEMEKAAGDLRQFMKKMQAQGRQAAAELEKEWPKIREDMKPVLQHLEAMGRAYLATEIQAMLDRIDQTLKDWERQATPTPGGRS